MRRRQFNDVIAEEKGEKLGAGSFWTCGSRGKRRRYERRVQKQFKILVEEKSKIL